MSKEAGTRRRWDMVLRDWLEASLSDWGRVMARHPWPVIVVMSLAAVGVLLNVCRQGTSAQAQSSRLPHL